MNNIFIISHPDINAVAEKMMMKPYATKLTPDIKNAATNAERCLIYHR